MSRTNKRRYERLFKADKRDYKLYRPRSERTRRMWRMDRRVLDQRDQPACVGYAWCHWLMSAPIRQYLDALGIYRAAKYVDEFRGTKYEGTSVRAGAKVVRNFGYIGEFRGTQDVDVLASTTLDEGPVVVGTNWYAKMDTPDDNGLIIPKGRLLGGHAWCIVGFDARTELFTMLNSWGDGWGENGRAKVRYDDMAQLLSEDGECWIGRELRPTWRD